MGKHLRLPFFVILSWACTWTVSMGGCSSKSAQTQVVCEPTCPAGSHCTFDGCVFDVGPTDLSVAPGADGGDPCHGLCMGATPKCNASGLCVACLVDDDCPKGSVCRSAGAITICAQGCTDNARCDDNPQGVAKECCEGACIDTRSDPSNCGGCGNPCQAHHASSDCVDGACQGGKCDVGWGDCNGDPEDGCEVNLLVDPANCLACGTRCSASHGRTACANGCYLGACEFGWDDCDGDFANGCEVSVLSDAKNCGACGKACTARPNAQMTCASASCRIKGCNPGFFDCDGIADNGCEVSGSADVNNCGGCGIHCGQGLICRGSQCTCPNCNIPNASAKCINNVCILDKCNPGFVDCNNNVQDGCEVDVTADPNNCGACANVCPQNANVCLNSMCTNSPCIGNQQWMRVTCKTPDWVWSRDSQKAKTVKDAAAARVLATGCMHGQPQPDLGKGVCSLDGTGWVSTMTFVMQGCNNGWWHLGGSFTGQCGGHDGDIWRHLVLTDNDCYPY